MKPCEIEGCLKPRKKRRRYCSMHVARIARHGDPNKVTPPSERRFARGPNHPQWQEEVTYTSIHQRLYHERGRAKDHTCPCGKTAQQWAYIGTREPGQREPYGDMAQYRAMCVSCHKRMDMAAIRREAS